MEKLTRRSDNYVETPSGLFAVSPKRASGGAGEKAWFNFKTSPGGQTIRVEWDKGAELVVIDADTAAAMLRAGYANAPTDEQVDTYNDLVAKAEKAAPKKTEKPAEGAGDGDNKEPAGKKAKDAPTDDKPAGGLEPPPGAKV